MTTIKIDGREIPFEPGDTVIRAAHRAGIDIPHYCWHPGLSVAANCRMCLVELPPPPGRPAMQLDILRWDEAKQDYVPARKPKLQPACQVACAPGMEVLSESSEHVAEARSAVQELLLLNHPVDCPICDQAGECRLQDYWLEHQRKGKRMRQEVVHKPKAVVFGPTIVYDAERCIICTRCVRFSDEVAKDPVLDVRERGNLNEITVSPGRQLDHDYTLMTEHVCPVGALTSIDFRFKARVWFLRSARTVCQGCATGCNAFLDYDPRNNTPYRHRPRENMAVNTYWMCDTGMLSYKRAVEGRLLSALVGGDDATLTDALAAAKEQLAGIKESPGRVAIVLSAQHPTEDNFALYQLGRTFIGATDFFVSGKPLGKADDILMSADKNPNTRGVMEIVEAAGGGSGSATQPRPLADLLEGIAAGKYSYVIALGSDLEVDPAEAQKALSRLKGVVTIAAHDGPLAKAAHVALPASAWAEAEGSYVNKKGLVQRSERALNARGDARPAWELVAELGRKLGYATGWKTLAEVRRAMPAGTWAGATAASHAVQAPVTTTEESGASV
ncbi:molybdopterin-dependent oxidoreductase [Chondromyces apiculatus]|uniref:NADH-ubiquinone oxidoreductase chain G n=1 Tax=Chondromyces apiculatus DSM 436 TaxID=1192034 RepID=A0A017TEX1_9BACT|nr:molybdopterin-dependent oxidoreductase [Chondromyces apiculatus]EYF07126.1 NADH-ubiquinone oxidoreductase chain G [Chondromyces apiculatus DSM 436]